MLPSRSARALVKPPVALLVLTFAASAGATEYYVAPSGNDSSAGTLEEPFATIQKGHDVAKAGDTVWLRGGTYQIVTPANSGAGIALTKSGTSDTERIKFWAYQGEVPVFDFAMLKISTTGYTNGFTISGSWLHLKGLEIKNVPMNTSSNNGISASGSNNIFELLNLHHNNGTGLFINGGNGGNLILNSDSHDNYDPTSSQGDGQNADGFGVHYQKSGPSTIIRGCRAWWNSDDGYDLINHEVPVTIEDSWAMGNGYIDSGTARPADGNGNGFKAGSSKTGVRHTIRRCLAWGNVASGFYANHSSGGNDWFNNTSYKNGTQYNLLASDPNDTSVKIILMGDKVARMRNNVGYPNKNTNMEGVDTASNSWDLDITPADSDFLSVKDMGFMDPRGPDGSMPKIDFMKLSMASKLIDQGVDVGLPFAGAAPDLGCFEVGLPSDGSGGTGGAGGASAGTGTGGAGMSGGASASGAGGAAMGGASGVGGSSATGGAVGAGGAVTGSGGSSAATGGTSTTGGASAAGDGGTGPSTGGTVTGSGGSSTATGGASGGASASTAPARAGTDAADAGGCGCRTAGRRGDGLGATLAALLLVGFGLRRRRRMA